MCDISDCNVTSDGSDTNDCSDTSDCNITSDGSDINDCSDTSDCNITVPLVTLVTLMTV